jgi:spermidine/putrescine transport system permease protein
MWTQVRFPQTLPTILALGACIFLGSATLILTAEWLRRMGTQQAKGVA